MTVTVTAYRVLKSCSMGHSYQAIQRHIRGHGNPQKYTILERKKMTLLLLLLLLLWYVFCSPYVIGFCVSARTYVTHLCTYSNFVIGHYAVESASELQRN